MKMWEHDIVSDLEAAVARSVIFCVQEAPYRFGRRKIADILRGSGSPYMISNRVNNLETYGLLARYRRMDIYAIIDSLVDFGMLERREEVRPVIEVTAEGARFFSEGGVIPHYLKRVLNVQAHDLSPEGERLVSHLVQLRRRLAERDGVRPYKVFCNRTLLELARRQPSGREELENIYGLGEWRIENYGDEILKAIQGY